MAWLRASSPADKVAIVLDGPIMKNFRSRTPWARHMHISADINKYLVAVAYPEGGGRLGRSLSDQLNPAIVDLYNSGKHTELVERLQALGFEPADEPPAALYLGEQELRANICEESRLHAYDCSPLAHSVREKRDRARREAREAAKRRRIKEEL